MSETHQILDYFRKSHATHLHARGEFGTQALIERLDCQANESILEIGCGTGATLCTLAALYPKTHFFGIDQSPLMLEKASGRLRFCGLAKRVALQQVTAGARLPFETATFDRIYIESVVAIQVGEAFPKLLAELKRILKPSGILCMNETVWLNETPLEGLKSINALCLEEFGIVQANEEFPYVKDWQNLLEQLDFEVISITQVDVIELKRALQVPFFTALRSKLYTLLGKVRVKLSGASKREWQQYASKMQEIHADGGKLMEGFLFKLRSKA